MSEKQKLILVLVLFGILSLALNIWVQDRFDRHETFRQINVLFHSDPIIKINSFVFGQGKSSWLITHPNFSNYFYFPIRAASTIYSQLFRLDNESEIRIRRDLAMLVTPIFSTANTLSLILLFSLLGMRLHQIVWLGALSTFSFSQMIFGSIPECFAINGFFITLTYISSFFLFRSKNVNWFLWIPLGVFGIGLTLTNVVPLVILFATALFHSTTEVNHIAKKTFVLVVASVVICFSISAAGQLVRGKPLATTKKLQSTQDFTRNFFDQNILEKILRYPAALAASITPGRVDVIEDPDMREYGPGEGGKYYHRFIINYSYSVVPTLLVTCAVILLILGGAVSVWQHGGVARTLALAGFLIIFYNWFFHSFWGNEFFLYSQHWMSSLMIVISGVFFSKFAARVSFLTVMAAFLMMVILNNFFVVSDMIAFLATY